MNRNLLELADIRCPSCGSSLFLLKVYYLKGDTVDQAIVSCKSSGCGAQFPVINGILILVDNFAAYAGSQPRLAQKLGSRTIEAAFERHLKEAFRIDFRSLDLAAAKTEGYRKLLAYYLWRHYRDKIEEADEMDGLLPEESLSSLYDIGEMRKLIPADSRGIGVDLGCSTGRFVFELSGCFDFLLGVDRSFDYVDIARILGQTGSYSFSLPLNRAFYREVQIRNVKPLRDNYNFIVADSAAALLPPGSASFVLCLNLLTESPRPSAILRNIDNMLAPGGLLLLGLTYNWTIPLQDETFLRLEARYDNYEELFRALMFGEESGEIFGAPWEKLQERDVPFAARYERRQYSFYVMHFFSCRKSAHIPQDQCPRISRESSQKLGEDTD